MEYTGVTKTTLEIKYDGCHMPYIVSLEVVFFVYFILFLVCCLIFFSGMVPPKINCFQTVKIL